MPSPFTLEVKIAGLCAIASRTDLSQNQALTQIAPVQVVMLDHIQRHSPVLIFDAEDLSVATPDQNHLTFFEDPRGNGQNRLLGLWPLRQRILTVTTDSSAAPSLKGQNLSLLPAVAKIDPSSGSIRNGFLNTPPQESAAIARLDLASGELKTIDQLPNNASYLATNGSCYSERFALRLHYTLPFDATVVLTATGFGPDRGKVETLELKAAQHRDAVVEISNFPHDRHPDHSVVFQHILSRRSPNGWPRPRNSENCDPNSPVLIGQGLGCSPHTVTAS